MQEDNYLNICKAIHHCEELFYNALHFCLELQVGESIFKIGIFWSRAMFPDPLCLAPGNNLAWAAEKSISNCENFITS